MPTTAVADMRRAPGGEILTFGRHVLWNGPLLAGHVDEVHLMIGSAFLGDGVPVFSGPRTGLRLLDVRQLDDSQLSWPVTLISRGELRIPQVKSR